MKKSILLPAFLCLGIGATYAQNQKTATPASQDNAVITPARPSTGGPQMKPVEKPQVSNVREIAEQQRINNRKNAEAQSKAAIKSNKSFHPNDGSGIITIDFGIVKQGDEITAFFPANFETLESQESLATHNMTTGDFIKFMKLTRAEGINAVKLARGKMNIKDPSLFRGFHVVYDTQKALGKIDEVVEVFTKQGNLQLRLTGFVASKDTKVSMK